MGERFEFFLPANPDGSIRLPKVVLHLEVNAFLLHWYNVWVAACRL